MKRFLTLRNISIAIIVVLLLVQFVRPAHNEGSAYGIQDIAHFTNVPPEVQRALEVTCYDCHSDHTNYPWYAAIQPVGLWIQHHVDEGKHHLNFSQYAAYKPKRQKHKMEETIEMIREGEMPMPAYTLIHHQAKLTEAQKQAVIHWAESVYNGITVAEE